MKRGRGGSEGSQRLWALEPRSGSTERVASLRLGELPLCRRLCCSALCVAAVAQRARPKPGSALGAADGRQLKAWSISRAPLPFPCPESAPGSPGEPAGFSILLPARLLGASLTLLPKSRFIARARSDCGSICAAETCVPGARRDALMDGGASLASSSAAARSVRRAETLVMNHLLGAQRLSRFSPRAPKAVRCF